MAQKYYAIVVKDPELAHKKLFERSFIHHSKARSLAELPESEARVAKRRLTKDLTERIGSPQPLNTLIGHGVRGCPDEEPWCENCGHPQFIEQCLAAGHCEACVTLRHGSIAHPAVIAANGYELVEVDLSAFGNKPPNNGDYAWESQTRKFLKLPPKEIK